MRMPRGADGSDSLADLDHCMAELLQAAEVKLKLSRGAPQSEDHAQHAIKSFWL